MDRQPRREIQSRLHRTGKDMHPFSGGERLPDQGSGPFAFQGTLVKAPLPGQDHIGPTDLSGKIEPGSNQIRSRNQSGAGQRH